LPPREAVVVSDLSNVLTDKDGLRLCGGDQMRHLYRKENGRNPLVWLLESLCSCTTIGYIAIENSRDAPPSPRTSHSLPPRTAIAPLTSRPPRLRVCSLLSLHALPLLLVEFCFGGRWCWSLEDSAESSAARGSDAGGAGWYGRVDPRPVIDGVTRDWAVVE